MKKDISVDELIAIVASKENAIKRAKAASALGRRGAKSAVRVLIGALSDKHPLVRMLAAQSLGHLADARALAALEAAASDAPDEPYRRTFRDAIAACSNGKRRR